MPAWPLRDEYQALAGKVPLKDYVDSLRSLSR